MARSPHLGDEQWFRRFRSRQAHIRLPRLIPVIDKQRAVHYEPECEAEFRVLGAHNPMRRRIILWRLPADNPYFSPTNPQILKLPFLAFADETIEDTDEVLLPIVDEIMADAKKRMGA